MLATKSGLLLEASRGQQTVLDVAAVCPDVETARMAYLPAKVSECVGALLRSRNDVLARLCQHDAQ